MLPEAHEQQAITVMLRDLHCFAALCKPVSACSEARDPNALCTVLTAAMQSNVVSTAILSAPPNTYDSIHAAAIRFAS